MKVRLIWVVAILFFSISIVSSGVAEVKYSDFKVGQDLYTRGWNDSCTKGWVWHFKVKKIENGVAMAETERAYFIKGALLSFEYGNLDVLTNMDNVCKSGGCYTDEESAVSDVIFIMAHGYCGKNIHQLIQTEKK